MLPTHPESWPAAFEQALAARDLDAVLDLYEPAARFVTPSGALLEGRDRIRDVLARLIATHTVLHGRVVSSVVVDDIAVLYTDFEGNGTTTHAIEVLHRQPDGTWKLIVGDPQGRG
jgi:uncharacterized protein (TIGR02246 family)